MTVTVPHFSMPLRFVDGAAAVVDQDDIAEIADCVANIARYEVGSRPEMPTFGVPDQTFTEGGADPAVVAAAVAVWEPRAQLAASASSTSLEQFVSEITVDVETGGA